MEAFNTKMATTTKASGGMTPFGAVAFTPFRTATSTKVAFLMVSLRAKEKCYLRG